MRKVVEILILMAVAAGLASCRKARFEVKVEIPADEWASYHIAYYAADRNGGGFWTETTLPLEKGKGLLQGTTREPTLLYIYDNAGHGRAIYVERGDAITLSGETTDPSAWRAKGNRLDEQWSEWLLQPGDTAGGAAGRVERFVKANPDSPLSALLLLTEFPRSENPLQFVALWNSLGEKAQRRRMAAIAAAADLAGDAPVMIGETGKARYDQGRVRISSLALRRPGGRIDTLHTDSVAATLLYFYRRDDKGHAQIADTLKRLAAAFPDSAKRSIAAVSFDPDSLSWQRQARADSLRKTIDAWMPLGTADTRSMRLGVASTPFLIVVSPESRQLYRGSDIEQAAVAFRKAMRQ